MRSKTRRSACTSISAALFAVFTCAAAPAGAELVDCQTGNAGNKVLLDDVITPDALRGESMRLQAIIQAALDRIEFEGQRLMTSNVVSSSIWVKRCEKRRPADASDFPPAVVVRLTDDEVVLELWGALAARSTGGSGLTLWYALIPYLRYDGRDDTIRGVSATMHDNRTDPLFAFEQAQDEVAALAYFGAGIRLARRANAQDQAQTYLCRALFHLKSASSPNHAKSPLPTEAMIAKVKALMIENHRNSRNDPGYRGSLRLIPDGKDLATCCLGAC